jgi:hypothetical protein
MRFIKNKALNILSLPSSTWISFPCDSSLGSLFSEESFPIFVLELGEINLLDNIFDEWETVCDSTEFRSQLVLRL